MVQESLAKTKNGTWSCLEEGDCCELFSEWTIGSKCPSLQENGSCGCYSTRPNICRVSGINIEGVDKDEYLNARCHLIHMLRKWRDEVGDSKSTKWILEKICKSGIR